MMPINSFITYDRLRSNTDVHQLTTIHPPELYHSLQTFINTFTNSKIFTSASLLLPPQNLLTHLSFIKTFGLPKIDLYNSTATNTSKLYYNITPHTIHRAITLLLSQPEAIVSIMWQFKFVDPISKQIIPNQDLLPIVDERVINSQMYVRLSQTKCTISPWFAFPFSTINDSTKFYIDAIKNNLPFKLSDNSWRQWHLSNNGN